MAIQATPSRRKSHQHGLSAWTAGRSGCEVSIESIRIYHLLRPHSSQTKSLESSRLCKANKNVHLEFSQCGVAKLLIDPQSRVKLQKICGCFKCFSCVILLLFIFLPELNQFSAFFFLSSSSLCHRTSAEASKSSPPRHGMHGDGVHSGGSSGR